MDKFIEEVILSNEEITAICKKIGKEITEEYKDRRPILVGLLKGCVPFMAELMKNIKCGGSNRKIYPLAKHFF